jgi:hypothetical protein
VEDYDYEGRKRRRNVRETMAEDGKGGLHVLAGEQSFVAKLLCGSAIIAERSDGHLTKRNRSPLTLPKHSRLC